MDGQIERSRNRKTYQKNGYIRAAKESKHTPFHSNELKTENALKPFIVSLSFSSSLTLAAPSVLPHSFRGGLPRTMCSTSQMRKHLVLLLGFINENDSLINFIRIQFPQRRSCEHSQQFFLVENQHYEQFWCFRVCDFCCCCYSVAVDKMYFIVKLCTQTKKKHDRMGNNEGNEQKAIRDGLGRAKTEQKI